LNWWLMGLEPIGSYPYGELLMCHACVCFMVKE
jgi:hypothetical protein